MVSANSLDEIKLISALLRDVHSLHSEVISQRVARLDICNIEKRTAREGLGFLTKSLPRLGKAFDRALSGDVPLDAAKVAFKSLPNSKLPIFIGTLFEKVFSHDGWVLPTPCANSIKHIRTLLYLFYKYEVPYAPDTEQTVLDQFTKTELEIRSYDETFNNIFGEIQTCQTKFAYRNDRSIGYELCHPLTRGGQRAPGSTDRSVWNHLRGIEGDTTARGNLASNPGRNRLSLQGSEESAQNRSAVVNQYVDTNGEDPFRRVFPVDQRRIIRRARKVLNRLFLNFDPTDIVPRHGPGVVSTKETLWDKYTWSNIPNRLAEMYPIDEFFYSSLGHVCDSTGEILQMGNREDLARVILVPKDSRGPRLISCEPLVFQWIQQGLGRAIVRHTERHPLTRDSVRFADQQPNRMAALLGSRDGRYATLDLKEASDRVTVGLVRLLFPEKVLPYLLAARSLGTMMPDGSIIYLRKYAPMGSALCFPVLALTVWSILSAALHDADVNKNRPGKADGVNIYVYGDDVIVPTAHAENAIKQLELFGLLCNHDKSCVSGFFRESCGLDAYRGIEVTPVRIRTKIPSRRSPESYCSWLAYANQFYDRKYFKTYELIAGWMLDLYGRIPKVEARLGVPSLYEVPNGATNFGVRYNRSLQKMEQRVWSVKSVNINKPINGWKMLLRYFTSGTLPPTLSELMSQRSVDTLDCEVDYRQRLRNQDPFAEGQGLSVSSYTKRRTVKLVRRWR